MRPIKIVAGTSISPFALSSVTTSDFGWLHPDAWGDIETKFYANRRYFRSDGILRLPPFVLDKYKNTHFFEGKWLLKFNDEIVAWAELHCFDSVFCRSFLFIEDTASTVTLEQISLLISAVLIESECDLLNVIQLHQGPLDLRLLDERVIEDVWLQTDSMTRLMHLGGLKEQRVHKITPQHWWSSPNGSHDRQALSYLAKRKEFDRAQRQKRAKRKNRPRPRGLFGFLFPSRR